MVHTSEAASKHGTNGTPAAAIAAALRVFVERDAVTEIRILNTGRSGTVSGYYDDLDKAACDAARWSGHAPGVYFIPNIVNPALMARGNNRLVDHARQTTSDTEIITRHWLLIDFDAVNPAGISSTGEQHNAALDRAKACRDWLTNQGWPAPVFGDSGNGAHLNYRIDLPNDDASRELVSAILAAIDFQFTDNVVKVDRTTFNAARIWKLYGTIAAKGDATQDRPHRLSRLVDVPDQLTNVPRDLLELVAGMALKAEPARKATTPNNYHANGFDLDRWIAEHGLPVVSQGPWDKGHRWILNPCPWNPDHTNRAAFIVRFANGAIAAGCRHDGCAGKKWHDLRELFEPGSRDRRTTPTHAVANDSECENDPHDAHGGHGDDWEGDSGCEVEPPPPPQPNQPSLVPVPLGELITAYPRLRPAVIDGLLREGETLNIIASPKVGKSWAVDDLALSIASGRPWLSTFSTVPGNVLVLDNELHGQTVANRFPRVAAARGIDLALVNDRIFVQSLRGKLQDIFALESYFLQFKPGQFKVIVLDALYRFYPAGTDENDNAGMAKLFNQIDRYADHLQCCFVLIHHSSKGSQAAKAVTDVGSGAGSLSRASDAHLVLRQHEEKDTVVLEAACRSWPPIEPLCLRWDFPVWNPAVDLDPTAVKGASATRAKREEKEREKADQVVIDAAAVLHAMQVNDPDNAGMTFTSARESTGLSGPRFGAAVTRLRDEGKIGELPGRSGRGKGASGPARILKRVIETLLGSSVSIIGQG